MPRILFFSINGSGMGHLSRCLAYARRMRDKGDVSFFSLASAIEHIEDLGFQADYFVSPFWSCNSTYDWNTELTIRFGMMLDRIRPDVVVFDGTWPFQGFLAACQAFKYPLKMVWSKRGLLKKDAKKISVDRSLFDLIIQPGELGSSYNEIEKPKGRKTITVPPVSLFDTDELFDVAEARHRLHLKTQGLYALFSLGPGNLKDMGSIGYQLVHRLRAEGYTIVWACAPISQQDTKPPQMAIRVSTYPLVQYFKAFNIFVGAAGYNTCCEVVQTQIPSLLIPNTLVADDQSRRAHLVADYAPAVVSACETLDEMDTAIHVLLKMAKTQLPSSCRVDMNGALLAANAILALAKQ